MKNLEYELIFTTKNIGKLNGFYNEIITDDFENRRDKIRKIYLRKSIIIYKEILLENREMWVDFASNFKDLILFLDEYKFQINEFIYKNIKEFRERFKFVFTENIDKSYVVEIDFKSISNQDFKGILNNVYKLENRNKEKIVTSDPFMMEKFNYGYYKSKAQKIAIDYNLRLKEGSSLLVVLPTGTGKSLIYKAPILLEKGLNVLIVPTVSLALDQSQNINNELSIKTAVYHGKLKSKEKSIIKNNLIKGTIDLLIISPEALITNEFTSILLSLAEKNMINRVIFDEIHIMVSWGNFFRVEYQMVVLLWEKILRKSNFTLKTLLLTATIDDFEVELIKKLFAFKDELLQVRGDKFRDEFIYLVNKELNDNYRDMDLIEKIELLPKPTIVYLDALDHIDDIYNKLLKNGYTRICKFTSKTKHRDNIIREWKMDNIDIVIASSAFGMGVDKQNIRSIIHGFVPENLTRLYQEVGRGGRDGYTCVSYLTYNKIKDVTRAKNFTEKIISSKNALIRWKEMIANATKSEGVYYLNSKTIPPHLKYRSELNRSWNIHLLFKMHLAGVIRILSYNESNENYDVCIKILNNKYNDDLMSEILFEEKFKSFRNYYNSGLKTMQEYLDEKNCILELVRKTNKYYPIMHCLNCNYCRKKINSNFPQSEYVKIEINDDINNFTNYKLSKRVFESSGFYYKKKLNVDEMKKLLKLGFDCIILNEKFTKKYYKYGLNKKITFVDIAKYENYPKKYFLCFSNILIILDNESNFYYIKNDLMNINSNAKVVLVGEEEQYIYTKNRLLKNILNNYDPITRIR